MSGLAGITREFQALSLCFSGGISTLEEEVKRVATEAFDFIDQNFRCCTYCQRNDPERAPLLEYDFMTDLISSKESKTVDEIDPAHEAQVFSAREALLNRIHEVQSQVWIDPVSQTITIDPFSFLMAATCFKEAKFAPDLSRSYKGQLILNIVMGQKWLGENKLALGCWRASLKGVNFAKKFTGVSREAGSFFREGETGETFVREAEKWVSCPLKDMKTRGVIPDFLCKGLLSQRIGPHQKKFVFSYLLGATGFEVGEFRASLTVTKKAGGVPEVKVNHFKNMVLYLDQDPPLLNQVIYELAGVVLICDNAPT